MRDTTLLFLVKKEGETITDICLAVKKRGFGAGRYNGYGGKVETGESIEEAIIREVLEESTVSIGVMKKVGEIEFRFPHNPNFDQLVHVYLSEAWSGEPIETEEMKPTWVTVNEIPYKEMWADDIFWLPKVLEGDTIQARFVFGEGDVVKEQEVNIIN